MAVFFNHPIQPAGLDSTSLVHHQVEWHGQFALLAVASKNETTDADGAVNFYLDEGEVLEDASIHRSTVVECMQWHQEKKIMSIGWRSGEVTTYNGQDHEFFEQSSIHRSPIRVLRWNQSGTQLISGDKSGLLVVWKVDSRGQLHPSPLHQHRLQAPITHCAMLHPPSPSFMGLSLPGDRSVLDAFSWERKTTAMSAKASRDSIACFCATADGTVYYIGYVGECVERFKVEGPVHSLLLHNERQVMAVVTQDMVLSQFSVNSEGQTTQTQKAKLSGKNKATSIIWVTDGVLASCSNESIIRFWDFDRGDNYVLDVQQHALITNEVITSISFNSDNGMLAGGTSAGNVVMWRWKGAPSSSSSSSSFSPGGSSEGPNRWEYLTSSVVAGPVKEVKWGAKKSLLAVNSGTSVEILTEHALNAHFNQQVSAVQVSPSEVLVECHSTGVMLPINSDIRIRGIYVTKEHVALWSGKKFVVYNISQEKSLVRVAGSFASEAQIAALYELNVYTAEKNQIHVRTCQGTVKQLLTCSEQEGSPVVLGVSGHFLVMGTNTGYVKMWDLGRREAKVQCSKQMLAKNVLESSQVVSVSCNCNGSRISIIAQQPNRTNWLLLWNIETDVVRVFNPATFHTQSDSPRINDDPAINMPLPELADSSLTEQLGLSVELLGRHPVSHFWDPGEPRLLAVEFTAPGGSVQEGRTKERKGDQLAWMGRRGKYPQAETVVVSLFVTQELSVLISDVTPADPTLNNLIGIHIPFLYFTKKAIMSSGHQRPSSPSPSSPGATVVRVTLRDFVGLEQSDLSTLQAMVEFSYHSTVGNMEEAFKSIKLIKSESVWENMARMCVKTQRLDVAAICLGNMGNARAAKAVREAWSIVEPEARLAVLAVQLGMLDEAEELYKKSQRYDLLNQFYQASGQWSKAMEVAESRDRMHLKTTYYAYAKHAEALGEYPAAISSYEKSETHHFEVPRMLLDDPLELENYVMKSKDRGIRKWWAEYLESMGELEQAIQFYETAKDYYSLVRLLCFTGNLERAVEVVEESGSKAAAYQLARRLSMENEVKKAIHFYTKAQCYNPAIQLAKEHGLENELLNLALLSSREDKRGAAKYYEANPETLEKAIMLYHKAGEVSRALELCFLHQKFDILHQIAEDLEGETSPEMAGRVAEYFQQHGQYDKAAELLIQSGRFREALDLCMANSVTITEELAERMTIAKTPNESPAEAERRVQVLEYLAECCASQGSYHLATKKYTQAGNKTKAMKALLKSGDTEKIVFFAGVSRQKDIYVMAANYLQSLDWQRDAEIMKNIISFYTKGRAMESLAGFYDACAQVEIDEFQNYAKALGALNEALKCLGKAKPKNQTTHEAKMNFLKERIDLVQRFADARRVYESDPEGCIHQCQSLLDEPHLDTAVRVGDIYGLMIEHYGQGGKYKQAYSLMEEMRQRIPTVNMVYYVDIRTLEAVHSALGIPLGRGIGADVKHGSGRVSGDAGGEEEEEEEESDGEESVGEEAEEGY